MTLTPRQAEVLRVEKLLNDNKRLEQENAQLTGLLKSLPNKLHAIAEWFLEYEKQMEEINGEVYESTVTQDLHQLISNIELSLGLRALREYEEKGKK